MGTRYQAHDHDKHVDGHAQEQGVKGKPHQIARNDREQYVLLRTEDNEAAQRALAKAGFEAKPGDRDSLRITQRMEETPLMAKTIVEAGIGLRELSEHSVSLEDYYLRMTGGEHRDESL